MKQPICLIVLKQGSNTTWLLDSQFPVTLILSILTRQPETFHTLLSEVGRWGSRRYSGLYLTHLH